MLEILLLMSTTASHQMDRRTERVNRELKTALRSGRFLQWSWSWSAIIVVVVGFCGPRFDFFTESAILTLYYKSISLAFVFGLLRILALVRCRLQCTNHFGVCPLR